MAGIMDKCGPMYLFLKFFVLIDWRRLREAGVEAEPVL
jgi:hypothetical protein